MLAENFHRDYDRAPWRKVPIAEVTRFTPGRLCCAPSYWAVTPDDCVVFYVVRGALRPQRNTNAAVVKHLHPDLEARFIEQAYMPREE